MKSSAANFAQAGSGRAEHAFPILLLVNATVSTLITALFVPSAVHYVLNPPLEDSAAPFWGATTAIATIVILAWLALVGRRRGWNDGATMLLGLPSLLLNLVFAIGVAAIIIVGPV